MIDGDVIFLCKKMTKNWIVGSVNAVTGQISSKSNFQVLCNDE